MRSREQLLDAVIDMPGVIVLGVDHEGRVTFANPSASVLLGYDPTDESSPGRGRLRDLVHDSDLGALEDLAHTASLRLRTAEEGWRWFDGWTHADDAGVVLLLTDVTELRSQLEHRSERFRLMAQYGQDVLVVLDHEYRVRWASDAARRQLRHELSAIRGKGALELVHPDDHARAAEDLAAITSSGPRRVPTVVRLLRGDGGYEQVEITGADLLSEPAVNGIVLQLRVVTERVAAEERMRDAAREMARLTRVLGATSDLVAITSRSGELLYVNDAFCEFFSVDRDNLEGFDFGDVSPAWAQQVYAAETIPALRDDGLWQGEFAFLRAGREVPVSALFIAHRDEDGVLEFVSSITRDISDRKALEERLAHQATHDSLTDLPNRALLMDRLQLALARAARSGATIGLIFVDLDNFKDVNDTHGHRGGDHALVAIAKRLQTVVRPSDTVARFGGDEFVVLCDGLVERGDGRVIAERLTAVLEQPIDVEGGAVVVTGSAGLAFASGGGNAERLLRDADAAMYRAKAQGRARLEVAD
jgi:diguanylate cyclase (GGDEF)-like protein/PAS domain S-box-containing protein